jgi:hypothetical protein
VDSHFRRNRQRIATGVVLLGAVLLMPVIGTYTPSATPGSRGHVPALRFEVGPMQRVARGPLGASTNGQPQSNPPVFSDNWSGYLAQAQSPFTSVETTYSQPAVTCPIRDAFTVFWVGLDGFTNGTVEQDGTAAECVGLTPHYYAWWEMYPTNFVQPTIPVAPGDQIKAAVHYGHGRYTMTVSDLTTGRASTQVATCASNLTCARDSAEWIVERPGLGGNSLAHLADWGAMALAGDRASTGGAHLAVGQFPNTPIEMVSNGKERYLAQVAGLGFDGSTFEDVWDSH